MPTWYESRTETCTPTAIAGSQDAGNSGTTDGVFNVRLSNPSAFTVTADYATEDDTAVTDEDYVAAEMVKAFLNSIEYRQRFGQP
jgi:hypothetical protein